MNYEQKWNPITESWEKMPVREGGPGSGNFGHGGRPGEVGGSGEVGVVGEKSAYKSKYETNVENSRFGTTIKWGRDGINGSAHFPKEDVKVILKNTPENRKQDYAPCR